MTVFLSLFQTALAALTVENLFFPERPRLQPHPALGPQTAPPRVVCRVCVRVLGALAGNGAAPAAAALPRRLADGAAPGLARRVQRRVLLPCGAAALALPAALLRPPRGGARARCAEHGGARPAAGAAGALARPGAGARLCRRLRAGVLPSVRSCSRRSTAAAAARTPPAGLPRPSRRSAGRGPALARVLRLRAVNLFFFWLGGLFSWMPCKICSQEEVSASIKRTRSRRMCSSASWRPAPTPPPAWANRARSSWGG